MSVTRDEIARSLEAVRSRTLALADALTEDEQREQWSPLMSPVVWDLAHVGNYEEIWLQRALGGPEAEHPGYDDLYDAFKHKRADRPSLPLLGPAEARRYVAAVRERVLDRLSSLPGDDPFAAGGDRLLDGAFVYGMVVQHEHQHDETILATRQLMGEAATPPVGTTPAPAASSAPGPAPGGQVLVPGGRVTLGTDLDAWAYDNERPAHEVEVAPFLLDVTPVTNEAYLAFVDDGGYDAERWWKPEGWAWRHQAGLVAPQFGSRGADGGPVLRFGGHLPLAPAEPLICLARVPAGIPFGAPDGGMTDLFFLILSHEERWHLHVLARLALMLTTDLPQRLREAESSEDALAAILQTETELLKSRR